MRPFSSTCLRIGTSSRAHARSLHTCVRLAMDAEQLTRPVVEIVVGIGLGYVPGVDNFAHLGGMAMGLLLAVWLCAWGHVAHRHDTTRSRDPSDAAASDRLLRPARYRRPCRSSITALIFSLTPQVVLAFVLSIRNFYTVDPSAACGWCRYLSCECRACRLS